MTTLVSLASAKDVVQVVASREMEWPEGQRSVEVELSASGYQLARLSSDALEPGSLLEQLQETGTKAVASVTVVRMGRGGIAYVWLPEVKQMYRVVSSESDPARAANVLSLRVAELVSLRGEGFDIDRTRAPEPGRDDEVDRTPRRSEEESERSDGSAWSVHGGAGLRVGSGLSRPLPTFFVGVNRRISPWFGVELGGGASAATVQPFAQGAVRIADQALMLAALLQHQQALLWQLGPALGVRCYHLRSTPPGGGQSLSRRACGATFGLLARVGYRWDDLSVWLSAIASEGGAPIRLLDDAGVVATLGRPDGMALLGAGWHF